PDRSGINSPQGSGRIVDRGCQHKPSIQFKQVQGEEDEYNRRLKVQRRTTDKIGSRHSYRSEVKLDNPLKSFTYNFKKRKDVAQDIGLQETKSINEDFPRQNWQCDISNAINEESRFCYYPRSSEGLPSYLSKQRAAEVPRFQLSWQGVYIFSNAIRLEQESSNILFNNEQSSQVNKDTMESQSDKPHRRFPNTQSRQNSIGTGYEVNHSIHEKSPLAHAASEMSRDPTEDIRISWMEVEFDKTRNIDTCEEKKIAKGEDQTMEIQDRKEINIEDQGCGKHIQGTELLANVDDRRRNGKNQPIRRILGTFLGGQSKKTEFSKIIRTADTNIDNDDGCIRRGLGGDLGQYNDERGRVIGNRRMRMVLASQIIESARTGDCANRSESVQIKNSERELLNNQDRQSNDRIDEKKMECEGRIAPNCEEDKNGSTGPGSVTHN
ncbi:MAG: hypothetical protein EZS28_006843, partial [Streblomastix strix]